MPRTSRTNVAVERGQQSKRYDTIPEGTYYGVIRKLKFETFTTNAGYDMDKFTPNVVLFNSNGTHIDRQDLTIGALSDAGEYTAEHFNNANTSVIFGGYKMADGNFGARNLMFNLAMLNGDGYVNFNEDAIVDVIVKVQVKNRSYVWNGATRHENVITRWDTVVAEDYDALVELGIETAEWVTNNVCVLEGEGDRISEFSRMVFETQLAYETWHDIFFNGSDEWQNEVGELGADTGEVGMENWDDWTGLFAEADEEIAADGNNEKVVILERDADRLAQHHIVNESDHLWQRVSQDPSPLDEIDALEQAVLEQLPENQDPDAESDDSVATNEDDELVM